MGIYEIIVIEKDGKYTVQIRKGIANSVSSEYKTKEEMLEFLAREIK
jgi:hypothetical protein